MFLLDILFGRRKVYRLRKKYDRMREKADRIKSREMRLPILRVLDQVEPTLVMLEEQKVSRFERARMMKYVGSGIREAKRVMEQKEKQKKENQTQPYRR